MKILIISSLLISLIIKFSFAQDPIFSQYHSNALYLNPAFAGAFRNPVITASYRNQWPTLDANYKTAIVQYHQAVPVLHGGLGGYAMYDNAGGTITTELAKLVYSCHLSIMRNLVIQPALVVGYTKKHINTDNLSFGDPIDPRYGFTYSNIHNLPESDKSFVDYSTGLLIYSNTFYGGIAIDHLTEPDQGFSSKVESPLYQKYTLHAGANIPLNDSTRSTYICPNIIYISQADFKTWQAELTFKINWALAGIGYRKEDAVILYAGYENNGFRLAYSYDKTVSKLAEANTYSHEIHLSYILKSKYHRPWVMLRPVAF